jgi:hypothetical protein
MNCPLIYYMTDRMDDRIGFIEYNLLNGLLLVLMEDCLIAGMDDWAKIDWINGLGD